MASVLSRVTIVTPQGRIDVALPSDVPLVDLLPTLLESAGGAAEEPGRRTGWSLYRMGDSELDNSRTAAQLSVHDGELLYLRPRDEAAPLLVYDDLVDVLAVGTRGRPGQWTQQSTRLAGRVGAILVLLAGAPALLFAGPPYLAAGVIGLALAPALLVAAIVFARALDEAVIGTAFGLVATAYAGVGGLLILAGDRPLSRLTLAHVAIAVTAAVITAAIAGSGVPAAGPVFLGTAVVAAAVFATLGLSVALGRGVASGAAVTVTLAYAMVPAMPMLAYRLAGLPRPSVPTDREHLRQETETVDAAKVSLLGGRTGFFMSAMLATLSIISAGAAVLVVSAGVGGRVLAGVLVLLPVLRSRWLRGRSQRLPLILAGGTAFVGVAVALFGEADRVSRLLAVLGVAVVVTAASIGFGVAGQRPPSPPWTRFLDVVETLLILSVVPLVAWVSGILDGVRAIRG
jgi:type VII secretion integral membrane protein EccD